MREGVLVRVTREVNGRHLGEFGIIDRINTFGGVDRYFIPDINENIYFFANDIELVDLKRIRYIE